MVACVGLSTARRPIGVLAKPLTLAGVSDFNGDHMADLLIRDTSTGKLSIWLMSGTDLIARGNLTKTPACTCTLLGTRADGAIFWRATTGAPVVWLVHGFAVSKAVTLQKLPARWVSAGIGDFDGDGSADLLWRDSQTGQLLIWFLNDGAFVKGKEIGLLPAGMDVAITGDFDGDGKSDILFSGGGKRTIWFMNGGAVKQKTDLPTLLPSAAVQAVSAE